MALSQTPARVPPQIDLLIDLLDYLGTDNADDALEGIPTFLAQLGPSVIPQLTRALDDQALNEWARAAVARALTNIAQAEPRTRAAVVGALIAQLARPTPNDPETNSDFVNMLTDLHATESTEAIRRAYLAGRVDEVSCGTLEEAIERLWESESDTEPLSDN